jgi:long-chain fatty acid transport protein
MKLKKIAALLAVVGMSGSAFATNGDNLIGLGAHSRALGGTGTAAFFGAENTLTNPALLGKLKGTEFSIAGTAFMPDVTATTNVAGAAASKKSDADIFAIPEVSLASRVNNNWVVGIGMFGTSGMGVDYDGNAGLFEGTSNLMMMKFSPTVAYNSGNWGVGAALSVQYGALDINYVGPGGPNGNGNASDFGYGFNLGAYFDITPNLTIGAAYQSEIGMNYGNQLTDAATGFGVGPVTATCPTCTGTITSNKLTQPEEWKIGVSYTTGPWMMTADYKRVNWGKADGYKTFNWDDQDIFGLGVKYSGNGWWLGAGYNYGKDPIKVLSNTGTPADYPRQAVNLFNNHFFPAVTESHFTFGGGMNIGKNSALDFAVVYANEVSKTIDTSAVSQGLGAPVPSSHKVDHSQLGITASIRMNF